MESMTMTLVGGLLSGAVLGWLLHRNGTTSSDEVMKMLRWKDLRLLRFFMLTMAVAIFVVAVSGLSAPVATGSIAPFSLLGAIVGGALFGIGMALCGYTPGTAVCAIGEGKKDAIWTFIGGLFGGVVFAFIEPALTPMLKTLSLGTMTWPMAFGFAAASFAVFVAVMLGVWSFFIRNEKGEAAAEVVEMSTKSSSSSTRLKKAS